MKCFGSGSLEALAECVNGSDLRLARVVQETVKGIYADMETLGQRLDTVEKHAVTVSYSEDGKTINMDTVAGLSAGAGTDADAG